MAMGFLTLCVRDLSLCRFFLSTSAKAGAVFLSSPAFCLVLRLAPSIVDLGSGGESCGFFPPFPLGIFFPFLEISAFPLT